MPREYTIKECPRCGGFGRTQPYHKLGCKYPDARAVSVRLLVADEVEALAQAVLDALDADKTPDFGVGHDKAVEAAVALKNQKQRPITGKMVELKDLESNRP